MAHLARLLARQESGLAAEFRYRFVNEHTSARDEDFWEGQNELLRGADGGPGLVLRNCGWMGGCCAPSNSARPASYDAQKGLIITGWLPCKGNTTSRAAIRANGGPPRGRRIPSSAPS